MIRMLWEDWYMVLKELASKHQENVSDRDAWREEFDLGKSPEGAFFEEYPEHRPEEK